MHKLKKSVIFDDYLIQSIYNCEDCLLYKNQRPLLIDTVRKVTVVWVGLSAIKTININSTIPLSPDTKTGKFLSIIENKFPDINFYHTNIVKCFPGLRICPTVEEMENCYQHLENEIAALYPRVVFLLGNQVSRFVLQKLGLLCGRDINYRAFIMDGVKYIPVPHPSFMLIYKRRQIEFYVSKIVTAIKSVPVKK